VLLTFVPAAYASVLAVVARHAGFNPVFAGLAWVGLELALRPLHLPLGLLTPTDVDPGIATSLTPLLGYAFVSFLVATANAYIAKKLLGLTARRDDRRIPPRPDPFRLVQPTDRRLVSHDAIRKGNARAPPQRKQRLVYIVAV